MTFKIDPEYRLAILNILHAAFHLIDDSEDTGDGTYEIDNDISKRDIKVIADALDILGIETHEDLDKAYLKIFPEDTDDNLSRS